jgi:hypothetical protein
LAGPGKPRGGHGRGNDVGGHFDPVRGDHLPGDGRDGELGCAASSGFLGMVGVGVYLDERDFKKVRDENTDFFLE